MTTTDRRKRVFRIARALISLVIVVAIFALILPKIASYSTVWKTLTYDQHFNVFVTDTSRTVVGLVGTIKVPGYGTVVEAGRLVLGPDGVVFESGRHQLFNGDVAGLCSYLSS